MWILELVAGAVVAATAFLPSWEVRGADDLRPLATPAFLGGHVIGAIGALAALAWTLGAPWPRAVYYVQAVVTWIAALAVGLLQHLLVLDCFQHDGRSPDIGVTTVPAVLAVVLWWGAFVALIVGKDPDPRVRSGRVAAAGAGMALTWFATFALGRATHIGNHIALVASLFLVIAAWNAAD